MPYSAEPIPSATVKSMLDGNWNEYSGQIPKPTLIDVNEGEIAIRFDLNRLQSCIIIRIDISGETETLRGSGWNYLDRVQVVELMLYTKISRQRLYDILQEIRRVCHNQMHELTSYQVVRYRGFTELTNEQQNVWQGRVTLSLENNRLVTDT